MGPPVSTALRFHCGRELRPVQWLTNLGHVEIDDVDASGLTAFSQRLHDLGARPPRQKLIALWREREGVGSAPVRVAMERIESEEAVLHRSQPQNGRPFDIGHIVKAWVDPKLCAALGKKARKQPQIVIVADRCPGAHAGQVKGGKHVERLPTRPLERDGVRGGVFRIHSRRARAIGVETKKNLPGVAG